MENERKVILEEVSMSEDDNEGVCQDLVAEAFYGKDTPLGRTIIGPAKNIKKFTRQDVLDYKSKNYISDDIVISISGHISREDAIPLEKGEYFIVDLLESEVFSDEGEKLGILEDIYNTGSNDIYVC